MEKLSGLKKKGTGYYKLGTWFLEADQHYTGSGIDQPQCNTWNINYQFYIYVMVLRIKLP